MGAHRKGGSVGCLCEGKEGVAVCPQQAEVDLAIPGGSQPCSTALSMDARAPTRAVRTRGPGAVQHERSHTRADLFADDDSDRIKLQDQVVTRSASIVGYEAALKLRT